MPTLGSPMKMIQMGAAPADVRRPAPRLGEHTNDVLLETGFSEDEIRKLMNDGVVVGAG